MLSKMWDEMFWTAIGTNVETQGASDSEGNPKLKTHNFVDNSLIDSNQQSKYFFSVKHSVQISYSLMS